MLMYVPTLSTLNCVCVGACVCVCFRFPVHSIPATHTCPTCLWLTCLRELFRYVSCGWSLLQQFISVPSWASTLHVHMTAGSGSSTRSQDRFLPRRYPLPFRWPVHTEANGVSCGSTTAQQDIWQGRSVIHTVKRLEVKHTRAFLHIFFLYWEK